MYKHMEDRGAPINRTPMIDGREVDLYRLFKIVYKLGGQARVTNKNIWPQVAKKLGFETAWCVNQVSTFLTLRNTKKCGSAQIIISEHLLSAVEQILV